MSKEAMKLALEALENLHYDKGSQERQRLDAEDAIKALEEALAKQEQGEPVARSDAYDMIDRFLQNNLNSDADYAEYSKALDSIYLTTQQRKPLTKAQVLELWEQTYVQRGSTGIEFARAIEAAHGIKE